jgi:hypothetical protein
MSATGRAKTGEKGDMERSPAGAIRLLINGVEEDPDGVVSGQRVGERRLLAARIGE